MTPHKAPSTAGTYGSRRWRFAIGSTVVVACMTVSLVLVNILGTRFSRTVDVTAGGEHRLSPRAQAVLDGLDGDYRIIVAADQRSLDARSRQDAADVLERFDRASDKLSVTTIDTGSAGGAAAYATLVRELVDRDRAVIESQAAQVRAGDAKLQAVQEEIGPGFADAIEKVRGLLPDSAGFERPRAELSIAAQRLRGTVETIARVRSGVEQHLAYTFGEGEEAVAAPRTDLAGESLAAAMETLGALLGQLGKYVGAMGTAAEIVPAAQDAAKPLALALERRKDELLVLAEGLRRMPRPDVFRVADALRQTGCVLLVGPRSGNAAAGAIAALETWEVYASGVVMDAGLARQDSRRRIEELLATGLASVGPRVKPIVVLMHAEPQRLIGAVPLFPQGIERLNRRGIDTVEWAVMLEDRPPALARLDPEGKRPIVYLVLSPNSAARQASGPNAPEGDTGGAGRAQRLGAALSTLADDGKNILLSLNPSVFPLSGNADPTAALLARFGLSAQSGKPLLWERLTPRGRLVESDRVVIPVREVQGGSVGMELAGAIGGLPTSLPWTLPIVPVEGASGSSTSSTTTLAWVPADSVTWQESEWLRLWDTRRDLRAMMPDAPKFDESKDARGSAAGWPVIVAAERKEAGLSPQRLIAVGSNGWFADAIAMQQRVVDGRTVPQSPGNFALLESAVLWLAFQDDLIAQSPDAGGVALIGDIEAGRLWRLRLGLIVLLPLLVLALGVVWRVVRG